MMKAAQRGFVWRLPRAWPFLLSFALSWMLAACGPILNRPLAPAQHDLGSTRAPIAVRVAPARIDVHAPGWLDGTAMQYRLAYGSDTQRLSYANSRWAAPPAELLQIALSRTFDFRGRGTGCRLVIDLDEFIQEFTQAEQSAALVSGVATLVNSRGRHILDRMRFTVREPAAGADAQAGVAALSRAVDGVGQRLAGWLDAGLPEGADGRCGA